MNKIFIVAARTVMTVRIASMSVDSLVIALSPAFFSLYFVKG